MSFTGNGDVSIWVKNSRVWSKTPNKQTSKQTKNLSGETELFSVFKTFIIFNLRIKKRNCVFFYYMETRTIHLFGKMCDDSNRNTPVGNWVIGLRHPLLAPLLVVQGDYMAVFRIRKLTQATCHSGRGLIQVPSVTVGVAWYRSRSSQWAWPDTGPVRLKDRTLWANT